MSYYDKWDGDTTIKAVVDNLELLKIYEDGEYDIHEYELNYIDPNLAPYCKECSTIFGGGLKHYQEHTKEAHGVEL